jgi:hypothetical protein
MLIEDNGKYARSSVSFTPIVATAQTLLTTIYSQNLAIGKERNWEFGLEKKIRKMSLVT